MIVETNGTKVSNEIHSIIVRENVDLIPKGIVNMQYLLNHIKTKTSANCDFGCHENGITCKASALKTQVN